MSDYTPRRTPLIVRTLASRHTFAIAGLARRQNVMKLFLETLIVFFGTLIAAGLVALGKPATAELAFVDSVVPAIQVAAAAQPRR